MCTILIVWSSTVSENCAGQKSSKSTYQIDIVTWLQNGNSGLMTYSYLSLNHLLGFTFSILHRSAFLLLAEYDESYTIFTKVANLCAEDKTPISNLHGSHTAWHLSWHEEDFGGLACGGCTRIQASSGDTSPLRTLDWPLSVQGRHSQASAPASGSDLHVHCLQIWGGLCTSGEFQDTAKDFNTCVSPAGLPQKQPLKELWEMSTNSAFLICWTPQTGR